MKKTTLFLSFMTCCFATFGQNQICVDGSSSGSGNGTPSNPYRTIQAAVNAASNGDIIKVAKGTYSEAVQISQKKVQLLGGFAGGGDFNSANPQANPTIIAGTSAAPCIWIDIDMMISGSLTINGFTIRNGQRGIELSGGWSDFLDNITIENNIIENNGETGTSQRGGGIGLEGKNVTIKNNIIRNNKSDRGAAIGGTSTSLVDFLIADNRIENNTGYGDHAGGVIINGTGTITRNIFDGNVTAVSDPSYGWGGAITIVNYDTTKLITLSHNIWRNNYAPDRGGAVFVDEAAKVRMEHELFYNNTTRKSGSAIYVDADYDYNQSVLYMKNCTVSDNLTDSGEAAMFVQGSIAHIENSIFWNNGSDFEFINDGAALAIVTVNYTLTQQGFTGTGNISSNPLFANPSIGDFHLKSKEGRFDPLTQQFVKDNVHSPAIDAGNPSSDYSNEPNPNGGRVNLGRYGNTAEASKSESTGIKEITQNSWSVFPNPTKGELKIENGELKIENVEIYDMTGRTVGAYGIRPNGKINIVHLPAGIYFVKITTEAGTIMNKVVKE
ncbi:MAG: T9SS type A sorting domain-containing protein [Bacteroidales bacterium]|nr:T9SS type A sorting domain-containing protein [Bacteroidales bacterium]